MYDIISDVRQASSGSRHTSLSYVFGTLVEIVIFGATASRVRETIAAIFGEFDRLHWKLHAWKSGDLVNLNRTIAAGEQRIRVDPEMAMLIREAADLSKRSRGLFNPAIGGLVGLWNFHDDECRAVAPDPEKIIRVVRTNPQMSDLILHDNELLCGNPAVQLDFGGHAKGYALDRAKQLLRDCGVGNALINIGGHILALGHCGERPWSVGIRHPRRSQPFARLELHDGEIISTSGDYERYFVVNGKRYAHIIDPRTGYPVENVQAATVLTPPGQSTGALSDAASGAVFTAGPQEWRDVAARMGVTHAMLVDGNSTVHLTCELHERLEFYADGEVICVH
ncbi:MAG: FAD:protein FMN transferase [Burkholderiales bacterium]|nr:FAD:protein FMN transferase [Burkholderiales bacterium]